MNKSRKKKVRQTAYDKLTFAEIQHLRRRGLNITKSSPKRPTKRLLRRLVAWWETTPIEKFFEDIVFLLQNAALLDIINLVAGVTIIVSLGTWWTGRTERLEDEKISAFLTWAEIHESGKHPEIARLALQRLVKKKLSLAKLDLEEAELRGVNLQEATLIQVNLQKATLIEADMQKTVLLRANLQEAVLFRTNLQEAALVEANMQKAVLVEANMQKAVLVEANMQEADLKGSNMRKAELRGANLQKAVLVSANLQKAVLVEANLQEAILIRVQDLTPQQIKSACFWDEAIYKAKWSKEKRAYVATEPDNMKFIEELKKDKSSDPKRTPDCSEWEK